MRGFGVPPVLALLLATGVAQVPLALESFDAVWTIVRDKHFDRRLNGVDWEAARAEFRPRAASARDQGELRGIIREMLSRLRQSHFALIPSTPDSPSQERGDLAGDVGLDVRLVDDALLVTRVDRSSSAARAGVKPGWRLLETGSGRVSELLRALPTENDRVRNVEAWRLAQTRLRGPSGSTLEATFEDAAGAAVRVRLERQPEHGEPVTVGTLPTLFVRVTSDPARTPSGRSVGVIGFNVWMTAVDVPFQKAIDGFRRSDGIILDLRGNPGGLAAMIMGIAGHFFDDRRTLGTMKTRDAELRFVSNPRHVSNAGERVPAFQGPLAILVDAMTGSASECFAGGMQSLGRARVFGQTSMGQALPALFDKLPNGDVLIHAYGDFVTSDGTRLEGRGVVPDEPTPLVRGDLLAGRDRALEAALAWIDTTRVGREPQHP